MNKPRIQPPHVTVWLYMHISHRIYQKVSAAVGALEEKWNIPDPDPDSSHLTVPVDRRRSEAGPWRDSVDMSGDTQRSAYRATLQL